MASGAGRMLFVFIAIAAARPLASAAGKIFMTVDEALKVSFPACEIERGTVLLSKQQQAKVAKLAGTKLATRIIHPYVATKEGRLIGTAYFDTHKVRTLRETILVVVDPKGRVSRIEVLAFGEPLEYLPKGRWYAQFNGNELSDKLRIKRKIRGITGATLSANAATDAVRRVLSLHKVIGESVTPSALAGNVVSAEAEPAPTLPKAKP